MNLKDYERLAGMLFGECQAGCGDCTPCKVQTLISTVWDSGRRSGAQSTARKSEQEMPWDEFAWTQAEMNDLYQYGIDRGRTVKEIRACIEQAKQWALSKNARRPNWLSFVRSWILRDLEKHPPVDPQEDLFSAAGSRGASASSRRDQQRVATVTSILEKRR